MLLLAVGVWRLHMIQSRRGGILSLIGALIMIIGYLVEAVFVLSLIGAEMPDLEDPAAAIGELAAGNPFTLIALPFTLIGPVFFGIATIRAKVYPRWKGIVLVVAPFNGFVVFAGAPTIIGNVGEMLVPLTLALMAWSKRNYHKTRKRKYSWRYWRDLTLPHCREVESLGEFFTSRLSVWVGSNTKSLSTLPLNSQ